MYSNTSSAYLFIVNMPILFLINSSLTKPSPGLEFDGIAIDKKFAFPLQPYICSNNFKDKEVLHSIIHVNLPKVATISATLPYMRTSWYTSHPCSFK